MDFSSLPIPKDVRWRRLIAVALFLGLLFGFRKLAPVLICFVVFERALGFASSQLAKRTSLPPKAALGGILTLFIGGVSVLTYFGVQSVIGIVDLLRREGASYVEIITKSAVFKLLHDRLGFDVANLTAHAKDYALQAVGVVTATAYVALFLFVGFILAIIYLFEEEDVDGWFNGVRPNSILGTMTRWLGYVADAIAITVRLQMIVAFVNAVLTLPCLLILGLPNVPLLFVLVLVGGMVPVVGSLFSGAVLCVVAYDTKGFLGVGVFLGVTFVLSKIESYYLSPRLTAQHVKLPGLVLVVSLLMFETMFGFYGLFLSFPALYVASRIANEWKLEEIELEAVARTSLRPSAPVVVKPEESPPA